MPVHIGKAISKDDFPDVDDVAGVQKALVELGYLQNAKSPPRGLATTGFFSAIQRFQRENELTADGVINPDGPTERVLNERLLQRTGVRAPTTRCIVCNGHHAGVYTKQVCYDCFKKKPKLYAHLVPDLDVLDEKIRKMMDK